MFDLNIDKHIYKHVHFIGIGGISMSGLATIMYREGYEVSGSDINIGKTTKSLEKLGIKIYHEHSPENIIGADLIVYTDAVNLENIELKTAIKNKVDVIDRASFLNSIMSNYEVSIAVSGTHGKTTTTSMLSEIIINLDSNPTILLGGQLDDIGGNIKFGDRKLFLTEACEYKANILKYFPTTAIVLNIDEDHLDYFDNIDHIIRTFQGYAKNLNKEDKLILNIDDKNTSSLENIDNTNVISIAINKHADYMAKNIRYSDEGYPVYDLYSRDEFIDVVNLKILGYHNIYNSLAAIAAAAENNISYEKILKGIESYKGVHRRLENKGLYKGARIIDDYAHHPTEIKASLSAIKKSVDNKLYCIFQPHTFTRTKLLLDSFAKSFTDADKIIITDIYSAREKDYGDIHSKTLCESIVKNGQDSIYIEKFEDIVKYLSKTLEPGDVLITMGAGDVYKIGDILLDNKKL
ncbi:UDP-N-acetylmuramate--L-alanine ligase [Peptoniphilus catoniae]|uniref:UDP-N-acetylmuramate--L-alanine ligase n=1 Tax=Peptoniphilus catoniae TaxID=1660341 RepID=UPI0010FEC17C|nr:UDP-N-acetylmuramate--L-alanine ligase [Peptoniphilus catoniae]